MSTFQHLSYQKDADNIVWLTLDRQDASANSLNVPMLQELQAAIEAIKVLSPKALIIRSGKSSGFVMGADVNQFKHIRTPEEAVSLLSLGQKVFQLLEDVPFTTIALIEGFCLGGGLELALACRYRVAESGSKVRLGLPEVKLGIHPGWGGSVRLPALIGALPAMDMMLTGRFVRSDAARKMGFVDVVAPKRLVEKAARQLALNPIRRKKSALVGLSNHPLIRPLIGALLRRQVAKKARKEHYPAPFALINNWVRYGSEFKAYAGEVASIGHLITGPTARHLLHVYFLQERLKSLSAKTSDGPKHIHVIGAGVMGGDIAAWSAMRGFTVTLQDQTPTLLQGAMKRAYALAQKRLKGKEEITAMMDRLIPDVQGQGAMSADIIIEAITERLEAKQSLFQRVESLAKPTAVLATNTSTIPLEEIRTVLKNPERLVGIHYFNPVPLMPLVEVVHAEGTDPACIEKAIQFVRASDKLPLPVKSSPGFLVNRILLPYMLEAVSLLEEGVSGPAIDKAAELFGMPMGPIELADKVGLDVCLAALQKMATYFHSSVPQELQKLVSEGKLGEKTGQGFYHYRNKKAVKGSSQSPLSNEAIIERLSLRLYNEAMAAMKEGIVEDAELLDAGSIFGFGFPPFKGGVMKAIEEMGEEVLKQRLIALASKCGERFNPKWE